MSDNGDISSQYPLGETQPERIRSHTGLPLSEITLEAIREGRVGPDDLIIHTETLQKQADIAEQAGYRQLANNLRRAAELVNIPNEQLLDIYEALRPRRSTYKELISLSEELAIQYDAVENARFIREAAEAYRTNMLLRPEGD